MMGMTILSGAGTTMAAGIILQGCQMTFFVKMSVLIIVTVASSLVWSLAFYLCMLLTAGPVGNTCALTTSCCASTTSQAASDLPPATQSWVDQQTCKENSAVNQDTTIVDNKNSQPCGSVDQDVEK